MRGRGFTLVELVITMVVLGILAVGVSSYIGLGSRMYADASEREQVLGQSRFVAERIVRELRNAVPGSVRIGEVTGVLHCLEFVMPMASGIYSELPLAPDSGTDLTLHLFNWNNALLAQPLVVYAQTNADIYGSSAARATLNATVTNSAQITSPQNGATVKLQLNSAHSFTYGSPERRFYILQQPVSYCLQQGQIYRYSGYGFNANQPLPPAGNGVLMADGVQNNLVASPGNAVQYPFRSVQAVLTRNAVVNLYLNFGSVTTDDMFFNYEVHLANVP